MKNNLQRMSFVGGLLGICGFLWTVPVSAAITIDGRLTPGETYAYKYVVQFKYDMNKLSPLTGDFYANREGNTLSVLYVLPKGYVDNTYGTTAWEWGKKGHTFDNLLGSDASQFALKNSSGKTFLEFTMDYISNLGATNSPMDYGSAGLAGPDGGISKGSASRLIDWESSLGYNFDVFGVSDPQFFGKDSSSPEVISDAGGVYRPRDSEYSGWVYEVAYEFAVDLSGVSFDVSDNNSFAITDFHASPSKVDLKCPKVIPEPTSLIAWSVLTGLGLVGVVRTRRQKKA